MAEGFDHTKAIPGEPLPSITEMYRRKEAECDSLEAKLKAAKQALAQERERVRELEGEVAARDHLLRNVRELAQGRVLSEHPETKFPDDHLLLLIRNALDGGRIMNAIQHNPAASEEGE